MSSLITESIIASCDVETETDSGFAMGSCARIGCATKTRSKTSRVNRSISLLGGLQLDSSPTGIQTGQRNRQSTGDVDLAHQRARDRHLQARHVAVRDDVRAQGGIVLQQIRIAE